jgi:hypothetical protein
MTASIRCDADLRVLEPTGACPVRSRQANDMMRLFFIVPLLLVASPASAQQGREACARDVSRFCRRVINDGDTAVLSCLQQNRRRLSRTCDKILTDNGQ